MRMDDARAEWLSFKLYGDLKIFLEKNSLRWEGAPDRCLAIKDEGRILASAAIQGKVIKYVCVDSSLRETGWATKLVSLLIEDAFGRGNTHLFLFTKRESAPSFEDMAFRLVAAHDGIALLECGMRSIQDYAEKLKKHKSPGTNGAIVMNANPFTLGHRYLIEQAAKQVDRLHVFMVKEDKSAFSSSERYRLVQEGTKDLENVFVHRGSEYILSHVTFPSYFIKEAGTIASRQAGLDVDLFMRHIVPALDIQKRFVGTEPIDEATRNYNQKMKEILKERNVGVVEIDRLSKDQNIVSASLVRKLLAEGETEKAFAYLPQVTREFLNTDEGRNIIERMKHI